MGKSSHIFRLFFASLKILMPYVVSNKWFPLLSGNYPKACLFYVSIGQGSLRVKHMLVLCISWNSPGIYSTVLSIIEWRSEHDNHTIVEAICSMLHHSGLLVKFWVEATHIAIYVINRTCTRFYECKSLFEMWYGLQPSFEHLRVFGCSVFVYNPKSLHHKLDP